jgi:hypothetical protein
LQFTGAATFCFAAMSLESSPPCWMVEVMRRKEADYFREVFGRELLATLS